MENDNENNNTKFTVNNGVRSKYSLFRFYRFLHKIRMAGRGKALQIRQFLDWVIYSVCFLIIFITIRTLYSRLLIGDNFSYANKAFVGLGFPLLFNIKRKDLRNIFLTLSCITIFFTQAYTGLISMGISYAVLFWKNKMFIIILLITAITFCIAGHKISKGMTHSLWHDLSQRITGNIGAIDNWKNIAWGERNKFTIKGYLLLTDNHSDLIQGFKELGVVAMTSILFFVLLPAFYIKLNSVLSLSVFASYISLLFQEIVDFPFRRWNTGFLGIIIILLMYYIAFFKEKDEKVNPDYI